MITTCVVSPIVVALSWKYHGDATGLSTYVVGDPHHFVYCLHDFVWSNSESKGINQHSPTLDLAMAYTILQCYIVCSSYTHSSVLFNIERSSYQSYTDGSITTNPQ